MIRRHNDLLKVIYGNTQEIYILTLYIKFHQFQQYIHLNIPIYKKEEKLIYDFILYSRNFLQQNEQQILHNGEYQWK